MKKLVKIIPVLVLTATLFTGCNVKDALSFAKKTEEFDPEKWCQEVATEGFDKLQDYIDSDLVKMMVPSEDTIDLVKDICKTDIDFDEEIEVIKFNVNDFLKSIDDDSIDLDDFSEDELEVIGRSIISGWGNIINSNFGGVTGLQAGSIATYSKNYVIEGGIEEQIWIVKCDNGEGVLFTFMNTGDDVVTVTTQSVCLPDDDEFDEFLSQYVKKKNIDYIEWN